MQRKLTLIEIGAGPLPVVTPVVPRQSSWFPVVYVSPDTPPVDGVVPVPVADGVLIEWAAVDQEGVIYIIERGPSENGPWTEIHRTTETRYFYSDGSGQQWWFKITASVRGKAGEGTVVGVTPGQVPSYEEMEELNNAIGQEILDRLAGDLKATNDAIGAARAYTDGQVAVLNGILQDIVGADEWTPDKTYPVGDFVQRGGTLYRALLENTGVVPGTDTATWQEIGNYTSVGDALAAAISMSTQNASDILAESTRVDAVVARMPAGTGAVASAASVSDLEQATADAFSAVGQRVGAVEATVPADGGRAASTAQVNSVDQARADGDDALALRINETKGALEGKASADALNLLQTHVQETDGRVQANAQDIASVRSELGGGSNLVPNAAFEVSLAGWSVAANQWDASAQTVRNLAGDTWRPPGINNLGMTYPNVTPSGSYVWQSDLIPVTEGVLYIPSVYTAAHRCTAFGRVVFTDASGKEIGNGGELSRNAGQFLGGQNLNGWLRGTRPPIAAPSGARFARFQFWATAATGEAPYAWFLRPMLEQARSGQTIPSPWVDSATGLDAKYAAATQSLETRAVQLENGQTQLMAQYTFALDVNGHAIGMKALNNGAVGRIDFVADALSIVDPGNTGSTTFEGGRWITRSGGYMMAHGKPFGATGDLMMWCGIGSAVNDASKANGLFWIDNKGNAYFGGSLSAGVLRNAVQTSTTQTVGTELLNGPFRTNGGNRTVTLSFARTHRRQRSQQGSTGFVAGAGANTAQVQLFRQIGSGGWVLWQTLNVTGSVSISNETDGPDIAYSGWGGSFTVNDSSSAQETVSYLARIVAFGEQSVTHQAGNFDSQTITQNLSIISVEQ
ncbi:hypothetical protein ABK045_20135 [Stenotrophomonas pavanii]|uniref:hypothetical protein n=1 Tax=Stenotrophomonas TaxID=40323 RepID=UPI0021C95853|nr:hypothetical protein [Stenotrophomonas sp. Sm5341]MCU1123521.1 hypothetical protein [Stenotrophomonas maltophilia]MDQ7286973.1 hypothetical protein [Stenotrophomonas sp. Sm5341]